MRPNAVYERWFGHFERQATKLARQRCVDHAQIANVTAGTPAGDVLRCWVVGPAPAARAQEEREGARSIADAPIHVMRCREVRFDVRGSIEVQGTLWTDVACVQRARKGATGKSRRLAEVRAVPDAAVKR